MSSEIFLYWKAHCTRIHQIYNINHLPLEPRKIPKALDYSTNMVSSMKIMQGQETHLVLDQ